MDYKGRTGRQAATAHIHTYTSFPYVEVQGGESKGRRKWEGKFEQWRDEEKMRERECPYPPNPCPSLPPTPGHPPFPIQSSLTPLLYPHPFLHP